MSQKERSNRIGLRIARSIEECTGHVYNGHVKHKGSIKLGIISAGTCRLVEASAKLMIVWLVGSCNMTPEPFFTSYPGHALLEVAIIRMHDTAVMHKNVLCNQKHRQVAPILLKSYLHVLFLPKFLLKLLLQPLQFPAKALLSFCRLQPSKSLQTLSADTQTLNCRQVLPL